MKSNGEGLSPSGRESARNQSGWISSGRACALLWVLSLFFFACATGFPGYREQIEVLVDDLAMSYPTQIDEVFNYATVRSYRLNLGLESLGEEIALMLEEPGPWFKKLLLGYLLALGQNAYGLSAIIEQLENEDLSPEVRGGLTFCVVKFLGYTEGDTQPLVTGWTFELETWKAQLERIQEVGVHEWRREYLQQIVLSNDPDSGERALVAAAWLGYVLKPSDVPFLGDLLERGCARCDRALLSIIEKLLMRDFLLEDSDEGLAEGIQAFRNWYEENQHLTSNYWIIEAFNEAGYSVDALGQTSLSKIVPALMDVSKNWILVRGRALRTLNRICGFHVDRSIIFMGDDVRGEAADSFLRWLRELADRIKVE
jgi:hypothetical protein